MPNKSPGFDARALVFCGGARRSPSHCSGPASVTVRIATQSGAATAAPVAGVTVRRPQYWPLAAALWALTVTFSVADSPAPSVTEARDTEAATPELAPTVTAAGDVCVWLTHLTFALGR